MNHRERCVASLYLQFAKFHSGARFNLATSGVLSYPLADLPVRIDDLEINGPTLHGYPPLREKIASRYGVTPDRVVTANGASMANHLAMAALLGPGDGVLIEQPAYDPFLGIASYLGAEIQRFERRAEDRFRVDVDEIKKKLTDRTRLIVLTNLHNPSSVLTDDETLRSLGEIAAGVGLRVLVNEVYLEAAFRSFRSSAHLGKEFVVVNSLTKAYGLSGLRCGWILCEARLAERIWKLNDLFGNHQPYPADLLSVIAFDHLDRIAARAKALLGGNRPALDDFISSRNDFDVVRSDVGTTVFPKLRVGNVDEFCEFLRREYETSVVPGRFFEMPQHFRIGIGGDPEMTLEGLRRLGEALDRYVGQRESAPGSA